MSKKSDIKAGLVVFLFGIAYYACSYMIKPTTSDVLGSRFFPRVSAVLLVILALLQIVKAYMSKEKEAGTENVKKRVTAREWVHSPLMLTIIALFAYYFLVLNVGFTITSVLYLMFESYVLMSKEELKNKRLVVIIIIVAVLFPVFLNYLFHNMFGITLPVGRLFE